MNSEASNYIRLCIKQMISSINTNYYGCILSRLDIKETDKVSEFAVSPDGDLLINPTIDSIKNKDQKRTVRDLLHEASHIALEHFARKEYLKVGQGNYENFNIAADCAIEAMLDREFPYLDGDPKHHDGLKQAIDRSKWDTSSTEELYISIRGTEDRDKPDSENHIPQLSDAGKQKLASALQQAKNEAVEAVVEHMESKVGKNTNRSKGSNGRSDIPDTVQDLLNLDNQELPENSFTLLSKLFHKSFGRGEDKDDSVFNQRNLLRRQFMGNALMGRQQRTESSHEGEIEQWHNDVVIYADVSGSMSTEAVKNGFRLVMKLAKDYGVTPVTVHTYNTGLVETHVIDETTDLGQLRISTGGGTNINRVFQQQPPSENKLVFVLTDMADAPVTSWKYQGKLCWLIHDNYNTEHSNFKIGQKIYINDIIGGSV